MSLETPVLIIGGGPVGFALAMELGWRHDHSIVVERDRATGAELLAKAGMLNERTMEICRRWGLSEKIAERGCPPDVNQDNIYCTTLDGQLIGVDPRPSARDRKPAHGALEIWRKCPQFIFDPILAEAALATGKVEPLYNHEYVSLRQDKSGVTAEVRDLSTGSMRTIRASYLVACDGAGSAVRQQLGLKFEGRTLSYSVSAMIRSADIAKTPLGVANRYMFIDEGGTWANLTAVDGADLWRFTLVGSEAALDPAAHDITVDLRRALGPDVKYEILRILPWRRSQCVIDRYRDGRVLFAGDSAHTTSPTGGHGLNTGIGDAVSLGWMLHMILRGQGGEGLLDAYEMERRPVAIRNSAASTENFSAWIKATDFSGVTRTDAQGDAARSLISAELKQSLSKEWVSTGIRLGYRYEGSPIIVPDGSPEPPDDGSTYVQTARPGHRAPHAWLADGRSTIDLFGRSFVLLRFGGENITARPIVDAAIKRGVPLELIDIDLPEIAALYERKLVLVRPDGHVTWRANACPADAERLIATVTGFGAG